MPSSFGRNPIAVSPDGHHMLLYFASARRVLRYRRQPGGHFARVGQLGHERFSGMSIAQREGWTLAVCTLTASAPSGSDGAVLVYKLEENGSSRQLYNVAELSGHQLPSTYAAAVDANGFLCAYSLDIGRFSAYESAILRDSGRITDYRFSQFAGHHFGLRFFQGLSLQISEPPPDGEPIEKYGAMQLATSCDNQLVVFNCVTNQPGSTLRGWTEVSPSPLIPQRIKGFNPSFSPDGTFLEVALEGGGILHLERLRNGKFSRLTQTYAQDAGVILGLSACYFSGVLETVVATERGFKIYFQDSEGNWRVKNDYALSQKGEIQALR